MRWTIGLIVGFAAVIGVNMYFLYVAMENPVTVEPTYTEATAR